MCGGRFADDDDDAHNFAYAFRICDFGGVKSSMQNIPQTVGCSCRQSAANCRYIHTCIYGVIKTKSKSFADLRRIFVHKEKRKCFILPIPWTINQLSCIICI